MAMGSQHNQTDQDKKNNQSIKVPMLLQALKKLIWTRTRGPSISYKKKRTAEKHVAGQRRDFTTPSSFFTFTSTRKSGGGKKTGRGPYLASAQLVTPKLVSRHHGLIIHMITDETNAGLSSTQSPPTPCLGIEERGNSV
jgi:hypothetical protein